MNFYLVERVLDIKSKSGNWEDLIFDDNGDLDCFTYDLLLNELNLSNESSECEIDEKIEDLFNSISKVGCKND